MSKTKAAARRKPAVRSARIRNPRRARFILEYLIDFNATRAAISSGYSKKTAYSQGQRLLKNAEISAAINRAQAKTAETLEITRDEWLRECWIVGRSDLSNHADVDPDTGAMRIRAFEDMPGESRRALESITEIRTIHESPNGDSVVNSRVTFKLHSKLDALKIIGDHCGFLKAGKIEIPGVEKALYELSEKFLPVLDANKAGGHEPK